MRLDAMLTNTIFQTKHFYAAHFAHLSLALMRWKIVYALVSTEQRRCDPKATPQLQRQRGHQIKTEIITMFHMRKCLMTAIFHVYNFNTFQSTNTQKPKQRRMQCRCLTKHYKIEPMNDFVIFK